MHAWILSGAVSEAGDVAWYVGLAWSAAQVASPAGAGLVMGIGALPRALILLFGGALADRLDARRTMIAANLGRIVVLVAAALVVAAAGVSMALLLTVAILFGAVDALYNPASGTLPRRMVRSDDLVRLAATRQLANRLAVFVGAPARRPTGRAGRSGRGDGRRRDLVRGHRRGAGVRRPAALPTAGAQWSLDPARPVRRASVTSARDRIARTLVIAFFGLNLCVGPVLAVGLVQRVHLDGWGSAALGWFQACSGISAAVGAVVALRWKPRLPARAGLLLLIVQAAGCVMIGLVPRAGVFVAMAMIGFTAGLASAFLSGAFQQTIEPAFLGRTSSIVSLSDEGLMPIAMTGFGALISLTDVAVACALLGTAFAVLMVWSASRLRG